MLEKFPYVVRRKTASQSGDGEAVASFKSESDAENYCINSCCTGAFSYSYRYEVDPPKYTLTTFSSHYGSKSHKGMSADELEQGFQSAFQRLKPGQTVKYEITRERDDA